MLSHGTLIDNDMRHHSGQNVVDSRGAATSNSEKGLKSSGLNEYSNPELWDSGAVFYQLSYQATWELVVMWVDDKPLDDGWWMMDDGWWIYIFAMANQHSALFLNQEESLNTFSSFTLSPNKSKGWFFKSIFPLHVRQIRFRTIDNHFLVLHH